MAGKDRIYEAPSGRRHSRRHLGRARRMPASSWYGTDLRFQRRLEGGLHATAEHRCRVSVLLEPADALRGRAYRVLTYRHAGLDVPGRLAPVPVDVQFFEDPSYETYGLAAADYPRVVADLGASSKHRMPDDALCLFYPNDPDDRRWTHTDGLAVLFEIVRHHLLYEDYWRATGGYGDGEGNGEGIWLGDEAPHGFSDGQAA